MVVPNQQLSNAVRVIKVIEIKAQFFTFYFSPRFWLPACPVKFRRTAKRISLGLSALSHALLAFVKIKDSTPISMNHQCKLKQVGQLGQLGFNH